MTTSCEDKLTFEELWEIKNRIVSYRDGFGYKRLKMLSAFMDLNIDEIVDKFSFETLKLEYIDFCKLLEKDKPCHSMSGLNCYCCICPNYLAEVSVNREDELYRMGNCIANSEHGFYKLTRTRVDKPKSYYIWDCINCNVPHNKAFTKKMIDKDLFKLVSSQKSSLFQQHDLYNTAPIY